MNRYYRIPLIALAGDIPRSTIDNWARVHIPPNGQAQLTSGRPDRVFDLNRAAGLIVLAYVRGRAPIRSAPDARMHTVADWALGGGSLVHGGPGGDEVRLASATHRYLHISGSDWWTRADLELDPHRMTSVLDLTLIVDRLKPIESNPLDDDRIIPIS